MEKKNIFDEATMKKIVEASLAKIAEGVAVAKSLVASTDYINWLQKFTFTHPTFCDDEWLYYPEQLEPENLENVQLLYRFIEGIEMHAESLNKENDEFGYSIHIRFNNVGYRLGIQHGQGSYCYCERCEIFHNESDFIDFGEIMKKAK